MTAPLIVAIPIFNESMDGALAVAEAIWSGLPRDRRVMFDFTGQFQELAVYRPIGQVSTDPEVVEALADDIANGAVRGGRRLEGWTTRQGVGAQIAERLRDRDVAVLVVTPALLMTDPPHGSPEADLLELTASTDCRVIGWMEVPAEDAGREHARNILKGLATRTGDRLWTVVSESDPGVGAFADPGVLAGPQATRMSRAPRAPLSIDAVALVRAHAGI